MAKLAPTFFQQLDDNGDPLSGGKMDTFESGTTTPKVTFTSEDESTANANPVILDAGGRADVWLDSGSYTFVLKDSADNVIDQIDNITGAASNVFGADVVEVSTSTNITLSNNNNVINCTAGLTLSLLDVGTAEEGFIFSVKNSSAGQVIMDPDASELIDGSTTKTIEPDGSFIIVCTGTEWLTYAENYGTTNSKTMTFTGANTYSGNSTFSGDNAHSGDNTFTGDNTFIAKTSFKDGGELTISSGVITITGTNHTVDTESDAASDDLDTINTGADGDILIIRAENAARTVVIKDGTGNIETADGSDITLDETEKVVTLEFDAALSKWLVLSAPSGLSPYIKKAIGTTNSVATFTTTTPYDDTIPQNTEGGEIVTVSITPADTTNRLIINSQVWFSFNAAGSATIALFQDSTAGALAAGSDFIPGGSLNVMHTINLRHEMAAGTTSSTTLKLRLGNSTAGTTTINGNSGVRRLGGVAICLIEIIEVSA